MSARPWRGTVQTREALRYCSQGRTQRATAPGGRRTQAAGEGAMRGSWLLFGLLAGGQAQAIGLCEDVRDEATVRALGPDRVAVDRVQEICEEADGEEVRRLFRFTEILDQAGNVIDRYAGPDTTPEALAEALDEAKPAAGLEAALKAGGLVAPAPSPAGPCTVTAAVRAGHLVAVIRAGEKTLAEHDLTENADPAAKPADALKTWWLPGGVVVIQVDMPLEFDQGALGKAAGRFSQVVVLGPDGVPDLAACKGPPPAPKPKAAVLPTAP